MNYVQPVSFWDSNLGIYIPNIYPPFMMEQYGITVSGGIYTQVKLFILKEKKTNIWSNTCKHLYKIYQ